MAGHYGASLVVQHVIELMQHPCGFYSPSARLFREFRRQLITDGQSGLQKFVNASGGIQPECIVQDGQPADAILALTRERSMSLIVLGTHGRHGFDRLMLGSVTERVLRSASCPVLAVRQTAPNSSSRDATDDSVPIRRILCCVDFSAHSERALEYALSLADAYDAEVTLLHVLDHMSGSADVGVETTMTIEKLGKLIAPATRSSTKTHVAVRIGMACHEILQFASEAQ